MKKIILPIFLAMLLLFLSPLSVSAGEKQLEAIWEQVLPEPNDLDGWIMAWAVQADPQTWDPVNQLDIDYLGGTSGDYSTDFTFTSPDGQRIIYVFRLLAYDTSGNSSTWTTFVEPVPIDFEAPPGPTTGTFRITIRVVPGP